MSWEMLTIKKPSCTELTRFSRTLMVSFECQKAKKGHAKRQRRAKAANRLSPSIMTLRSRPLFLTSKHMKFWLEIRFSSLCCTANNIQWQRKLTNPTGIHWHHSMTTDIDKQMFPIFLRIRRRRTWKWLTKTSILIANTKVNYLIQPTEYSFPSAVRSDCLWTRSDCFSAQSDRFHKSQSNYLFHQILPKPIAFQWPRLWL